MPTFRPIATQTPYPGKLNLGYEVQWPLDPYRDIVFGTIFEAFQEWSCWSLPTSHKTLVLRPSCLCSYPLLN